MRSRGSSPGRTGKQSRGCPASVISAEHVVEKVHHPVTVAVFVVVPGEEGRELGSLLFTASILHPDV